MGITKKLKNFFSDINNQFSYAKWVAIHAKFHQKKMFIVLALGTLSSLIAISFSLIVKSVIDYATSGKINVKMLVFYSAMLLVSEIVAAFLSYYSITLDEKIKYSLRKHLFKIILCADWTKISKYKNGDLQTRLTNDIEKIATGISNLIPDLITFAIQLIITFCVLFYFSPLIAGAALGTGIIGALICVIFKGKLYKMQMRVQESESKNRSYLNESCSNITVIKSFSMENNTIDKLGDYQNEQFSAVKDRAKANQRTSVMMNVVFDIAYIIAFSIGIVGLTSGQFSYGTLSMYIVLAGYIQQPMMSIASNIPRVIWMLASAGRIKEIESIKGERLENFQPEGAEFGIKAENLCFSYNSKHAVIDNANFEIKPREFVAIIGNSGSGKTTLIRLLLALVKPTSGSVSFIGETGEKIPTGKITRILLGYVPQGNTLVSGTIAENVKYGYNFATEDDVWEALKIADADNFVKECENGLDTLIGENGVGLSEGQAQRIAIARAVIRNSPIMIMDEATSALDIDTEKKILENLSRLSHRPTCFFVTHRETALDVCDKILKVKNGKISDITDKYKAD